MFDFFQPTHVMGTHTLRLVAEAQQGGGDIFDIARLCRDIEPGDKQRWERAWLELAGRTEAKAKAALASGHTHTAMKFFFHANQYYRMSDVFLTIEQNETKTQRFLKSQENFRAGAALHHPTIEVIRVQCGDEEYDGYFCHPINPKPGRWPVVFLMGGADAFAEEIFFSGRQALEYGWALLLVDTPGRGSSMYVKNMPTRPDYEVPGKACIDYLMSRPDVDPERIALMGISMAGYYAPRTAAFDSRVKALIAWSGCYSILDDLYLFCENLRPVVQRLLGGVSDTEARVKLEAYTMKGIASNIKCPTLITHGGNDRLMNVEGARHLYDEIGSKDKTLEIYADPKIGGTIHCSHDYWAHNVTYMLDWLEERL
jgi:dipeptidyl aminopeptidase/acylaminoacyl peptidase